QSGRPVPDLSQRECSACYSRSQNPSGRDPQRLYAQTHSMPIGCTMTDYDELLERAKWGKLTRQELDRVAAELKSGHSDADSYTPLHMVGRGGGPEYRELVEAFVTYEEAPMLASLALEILGGFWGEMDRYLPQVLQFLRGVPWDADEDCRLIAA